MLVNKQTYHGQWWLPEYPDKKVYGVLTIHASGKSEIAISMSSEDGLMEFFAKRLNFNNSYEHYRVIGLLYENAKVVTAEKVTIVHGGFNNGFTKIKCHPNFIGISNVNFETDNLLVNDLYLEIPGTSHFIRKSGLRFSFNDPSSADYKFEVAHHKLPALKMFNHGDCTLEAFIGWHHGEPKENEDTAITIKEIKKFKLSSDKETTLNDFWADAISLNYLICVLYGEPIPIKSIESLVSVDGKKFPITFYVENEPSPSDSSSYRLVSPFIEYLEGDTQMGELIYQFLRLRKECHASFGLFFSSKFSDNQYLNLRFFMIVTAIEGFHRQLRVPGKLSLEKRLNQVFEEFDKVVSIDFDWSDSAKTISDFRNQEAHIIDPDSERDVLKMHNLTRMLQVVYILLFMGEAASRSNYDLPFEAILRKGWIAQFAPPRK